MAKLTKEQYEANQRAKSEKKRIENEAFKAKKSAQEQADLEAKTRKPELIQQDLAQAYFRLGQAAFGIKNLEMIQAGENLAIRDLEKELEASFGVWGYPAEEVNSQGANDVVPQTQQ